MTLDTVTVCVLGPCLLRESCETRLGAWPVLSVVREEARVVVAFAVSPQDSLEELQRSLAAGNGRTRGVLVLVPDPVLLTRALNLGVRSFVGCDDRAEVLLQAVLAAARDRCFCDGCVLDVLMHAAREDRQPRSVSRGSVAELTSRQLDCAILAARGSTYRDIAEELFINVKTVKSHLHAVYLALQVSDKKQLRGLLASLEAERGYRRRLDPAQTSPLI